MQGLNTSLARSSWSHVRISTCRHKLPSLRPVDSHGRALRRPAPLLQLPAQPGSRNIVSVTRRCRAVLSMLVPASPINASTFISLGGLRAVSVHKACKRQCPASATATGECRPCDGLRVSCENHCGVCVGVCVSAGGPGFLPVGSWTAGLAGLRMYVARCAQ
jgi:hypothetical protein